MRIQLLKKLCQNTLTFELYEKDLAFDAGACSVGIVR